MAKSNATVNEVKMSANLVAASARLSDLQVDVDEQFTALAKSFRKQVKSHTYWPGRNADLVEAAGGRNTTLGRVVTSAEFRVAQKSHASHIELAEMDGKGNVVSIYMIPCRWAIWTDELTAGGKRKCTLPNLDVCKEFMPSIKGKQRLSLVGFSVGEEFTACTSFEELKHVREYEHRVKTTYVNEDGFSVEADKFHFGDDGKKVYETEVSADYFYPILDEAVSPNAFLEASKAALRDCWMLLFASMPTAVKADEQPKADTDSADKAA